MGDGLVSGLYMLDSLFELWAVCGVSDGRAMLRGRVSTLEISVWLDGNGKMRGKREGN